MDEGIGGLDLMRLGLVEQRQLTVSDAHRFLAQPGLTAGPAGHEAAVLRWLAGLRAL